MSFFRTYGKSIGVVVATILSAVSAALTDGSISPQEWVNVALLAAGAAAVFTAPNVPGAAYTKQALAVLTAVLTAAVNLIAGGITLPEVIQMVLAGLGALGVIAAPHQSTGRVARLAEIDQAA